MGVAARAGKVLQFTVHFSQAERGERERKFKKLCLGLVRWLRVDVTQPDDLCSVPRTYIKREGEI